MEQMSNQGDESHRPIRENLINKNKNSYNKDKPLQINNYEAIAVFDQDFRVDEMNEPHKYLPRYQQ